MDFNELPSYDIHRLLEIMNRVGVQSNRLLHDYYLKIKDQDSTKLDENLKIGQLFTNMTMRLWENPQEILNIHTDYSKQFIDIVINTGFQAMGLPYRQVVSPLPSDKRFRNNEWEMNPVFNFYKQMYLLIAQILLRSIQSVSGIDVKEKHKLEFYTKHITDALSPANFVATNPELVRMTMKTGGENLIKGLENLLDDMERSPCDIQIKLTDMDAFKVGVDLATTEGHVIFQNDLIQLIQYSPLTESVFNRPIVFVPPWINKYYILDLTSKNSMVKWMVEQGYTVFMISWVNPDERHAEKDFQDYMLEGPIAAINVAKKICDVDAVHTIGYCMGGTLLACTNAYLSAKKDKSIATSTYMTTLMDFSIPGDMGVFIDEKQISEFEKMMSETGYMRGCAMANSFNMLRPNELIWSYVINNYLKGKPAVAFDMLFWNTDSTNLPAKMHSYYLRNMYLHNRLKDKDALKLAGESIDLSRSKEPCYFISAEDDHIALWKGTYLGAKLKKGSVRFVLGGSGHVGGVVNPPQKKKHGYKVNKDLPDTAEEWLTGTQQYEGSWWIDWVKWNKRYAGKKVSARIAGNHPEYPSIEPAPGCYVTQRLDDPDNAVCYASFL